MLLVERLRLRLRLWLERVKLLLVVRVRRVRMMGQIMVALITYSRTGLESSSRDSSFLSPGGHDPSDEFIPKLVLFIVHAAATADQVWILGSRGKVLMLLKLLLVLIIWVVMVGCH